MTNTVEFAYFNNSNTTRTRHSLEHEFRCRGLLSNDNPGELAIRVPLIKVWPTYRCVPGLGREGAAIQHNGVLLPKHLTEAEGLLMEGYHVVFTKVTKGQASDQPNLYETPTAPCLISEESVMQGPDYEREYWKLRAAIRYGILRATEYKLTDTAILADRLLKGENPDEITQEFEKIVHDIGDQAVKLHDQNNPYRRYIGRGRRDDGTPPPAGAGAIIVHINHENPLERFNREMQHRRAFPCDKDWGQQRQANPSERH